jgi:hypothetical protein
MSKQDGETKGTVWVGPDIGDGQRAAIRFDGSGGAECGILAPVGPDADHVLDLKQRSGPFYDVVGEAHATLSGPPKVTSKAYRDGWTRVFGGKHPVGGS